MMLTAILLAALVQEKPDPRYPLKYPPALPDGKELVTDQSPDFLKPPPHLRAGVEVAKTAPVVDFLFYPGQDHAGVPWSVWGDGCAAGDTPPPTLETRRPRVRQVFGDNADVRAAPLAFTHKFVVPPARSIFY